MKGDNYVKKNAFFFFSAKTIAKPAEYCYNTDINAKEATSMGKGARSRQNREADDRAYALLYKQAKDLYKRADLLCLFAGILALLLLIIPVFCSAWMSSNLANGVYEAQNAPVENINELSRTLPLGYAAFCLIVAGILFTFFTVRAHKPGISLIGVGLCTVADVMLVFFALTLEKLFPYNPLDSYQRGLTFWDLTLRYDSLIIPTLLLIAAVAICFAARKKQDVADVMRHAADTSSTLSLDE